MEPCKVRATCNLLHFNNKYLMKNYSPVPCKMRFLKLTFKNATAHQFLTKLLAILNHLLPGGGDGPFIYSFRTFIHFPFYCYLCTKM